jgi:hypothetical protein
MALTSTSTLLGLFQRVAALSALHSEAFEHIAGLCADADADVTLDTSAVALAIRCALLAATAIAGVRAAVAPLPLPPSVAAPVLALHATAAAVMQLIVSSAARSVLTSASPKPFGSADSALAASCSVLAASRAEADGATSRCYAAPDDDAVLNDLATSAAALTASLCEGRVDAVGAQGLLCWWRFLQHRDAALLRSDVSAVLARHGGDSRPLRHHPDSADLYSLRALSWLVGDTRCTDDERVAAHADLDVAAAIAQAKAEQAQGWRAAKGTRSKVLALLVGAAFHRDASKRPDLESGDARRQLEAKALAVTKAAASMHPGAKRYAGEPLNGVSQHFTVHRLLVDFAAEMFSAARLQRDSVTPVDAPVAAESLSTPLQPEHDEGQRTRNLTTAAASRLRCDGESSDGKLSSASAEFAFEEHLTVPAAVLGWLRRRAEGTASPSATVADGESHSPGGTRRPTVDWDAWEEDAQALAAASKTPSFIGFGDIVRFVSLDRMCDALAVLRRSSPSPASQRPSKKSSNESAEVPPVKTKSDVASKRPLSAARPTSARLPTRRPSTSAKLVGGAEGRRQPASPSPFAVEKPTAATEAGVVQARKDFTTFAPPTVLAASALILLAARVAADRRENKRVADRRRQERAKAEAEARWERTRSASLRSLVRQHASSTNAVEDTEESPLKKAHSCVVRRPQSAAGRRPSHPAPTPAQERAAPARSSASATTTDDDPAAVVRGRLRPRSATLGRRPSSAAPVVVTTTRRASGAIAEQQAPPPPTVPAPPTMRVPAAARTPKEEADVDDGDDTGPGDESMFVRGVYGVRTASSAQ